jgi:Flp pilus assembly CpaE family ATPase
LRIEDLKSIVNHDNVYKIANDFKRVSAALNLGVPLCEASENSKIAHDLKELARYLGKVIFDGRKRNLLRRFRDYFS